MRWFFIYKTLYVLFLFLLYKGGVSMRASPGFAEYFVCSPVLRAKPARIGILTAALTKYPFCAILSCCPLDKEYVLRHACDFAATLSVVSVTAQ